jgi:hypothetical protein
MVEVADEGDPIIVDRLNGPLVSFQLADVDENKGGEVLAFYFNRGNQYGVRIYKLDGINLTPLAAQPVSSNVRSVKLSGKNIVVENEQIAADGHRFISRDTNKVTAGNCELIKEEKSQGEALFRPLIG